MTDHRLIRAILFLFTDTAKKMLMEYLVSKGLVTFQLLSVKTVKNFMTYQLFVFKNCEEFHVLLNNY